MRDDKGPGRPGLETTEINLQRGARRVPPPPEAVGAGAYPAVISGAVTALVGAILVVAGVLIILDALALPSTSDPLGPAAFPFGIGGLMLIVGGALAATNYRYALVLLRVRRTRVVSHRRGLRVLLALGCILGFAAVLPFAGFFVSAAALYVAMALLLGAPRGWHLPLTGVLVAGAIVLIFDRLIGLSLPAGPWGF